MVPQKQDAKTLLEASMCHLLETKTIEQITVREIASNCGLTTRAFYNHFLDKHDLVSYIYLKHMKPYIRGNLNEWSDRRSDLFMSRPMFFRNTIYYSGQNNLTDTIIKLDREKYIMHVRREVDESQFLWQLVSQGIDYMIYGNIGLLKESYKGNAAISEEQYKANYKSTWELMRIWAPQVVQENMTMYPNRELSNDMIQMMRRIS